MDTKEKYKQDFLRSDRKQDHATGKQAIKAARGANYWTKKSASHDIVKANEFIDSQDLNDGLDEYHNQLTPEEYAAQQSEAIADYASVFVLKERALEERYEKSLYSTDYTAEEQEEDDILELMGAKVDPSQIAISSLRQSRHNKAHDAIHDVE